MKAHEQPQSQINVVSIDDLDRLTGPEKQDLEAYQRIQHDLMKIDQRIALLKLEKKELNANENAMEVSDAILRHFCNGEMPPENYVIFKNVKLVRKGMIDSVEAKDNRTTFEVNHPDLAKNMKQVST